MAEGFRIHYTDETYWGSIVLITHPGDMATGRVPKDYVFRLDANGDIIVSSKIWERLEEMKKAGINHGFVFSNVVGEPPTQRTSEFNDHEKRIFKKSPDGLYETEVQALREIVPKGMRPKAN